MRTVDLGFLTNGSNPHLFLNRSKYNCSKSLDPEPIKKIEMSQKNVIRLVPFLQKKLNYLTKSIYWTYFL